MAFAFDETLPTDKDVVRAAIGDTDATRPLRSDEAIGALLARFAAAASAVDAAVLFLAVSLANEYRRKPSSSAEAGGVSVSWPDRVKGWDQLARDIRAGKLSFDAAGITGSTWQAPRTVGLDVYEPAPVIA